MKTVVGMCVMLLCVTKAMSQVDTSYIYSTNNPYGTLDIRLAKSATRYYYLEENKTFSFRESAPGVKTNTYVDMTSWDSSPYTQGNLREKNGSADYFLLNYRLLFPQGYNPSYPEGYPFIVMIHGAGERGNCWDGGCYWADKNWKPLTNSPAAPTNSNHQLLNNDHNLLHGGQIHLNARNLAGNKLPNDPTLPDRAFPGFVLFPQNLNGWDANSSQDVIRLIRLLVKKYNIDQNRIYIHGLSNGGYGTFEIVKRAPWLFSAVLPMSAISDASITLSTYTPVLENVAHIPFWIFQGGIDTNPTPSKTRSTVKKFRDAGATVRYSEYSNLGHGVWNTAYNEPDFFTWMLEKNKSDIHTFGDVAAVCLTTGQGVRMELAKGFLAYQWEKDGQVISDANAAVYVANSPGVYRARFSRSSSSPSESQWNRWSQPVVVTESNPVKAQTVQKGSLLLKDLNNYGNAHVSAVGDYAHYYWYKDGILVDLPGTQDDTTRNPVFKQGTCTNLPACTGNGVYTLVTAGPDNCPSPPSEPMHIFFNNQAPVNLTAPATFSGTATGPTTANVSWTDSSEGELGFEIWRRKKTGATTYSLWVMAGKTSADVTTFSDSGMDPSSVYQYKIRAVGTNGRSNYTPASSSQFLTITTGADTQPPGPPSSVAASATGIREITVSWLAGSDDTGVKSYRIYFDGDTVDIPAPALSAKLSSLALNTNYTFTVRTVDLGGNESVESNAASASTYVTGLYYEHSTGGWTDLDQINWDIAEYTGKVNNITLAPRTQEDYFNFEFNGYLYINISGSYQFRTISDDGSRLLLNNAVIVENDGLHGNVTVTSQTQWLSSGPQEATIRFFEYTGGQSLTVQYRGPDTGSSWITIPDAAWKSGNNNSAGRIAASQETQTPITEVDVYPNPLSGHENLKLVVRNPSGQAMKVRLTDMMGEVLYTSVVNDDESGQLDIVTTRQLTKGVYLLVVEQNGKIVKRRVAVKD